MCKTTVWDDGNVVIDIENVDGYPFLHCSIDKWNKTTKHLCLELLNRIVEYYGVVYCLSTNTKTNKFAYLLGFEKALSYSAYTIFVKD